MSFYVASFTHLDFLYELRLLPEGHLEGRLQTSVSHQGGDKEVRHEALAGAEHGQVSHPS